MNETNAISPTNVDWQKTSATARTFLTRALIIQYLLSRFRVLFLAGQVTAVLY